jgi:WD40 repeat protein
VAFSPDGTTLASAEAYLSADLKPGVVFLWDVRTGGLRRPLKGHTGGVWSVVFSPDGKTLASASADRTIKLWDVATGDEKATLAGHGEWVRSVAFSPDAKTLASASGDMTVKLWDVAAGKERATLRGHTGAVACLAISPEGRSLASVAFDNTIRVWDMATGKQQNSLSTKNVSYAMSFSPDGTTLALGGFEGIQLWDAGTWKLRATLKLGTPNIYGVAFAPDGTTLAAACSDKTVKLWDLKDRRGWAVLPHGNVVLCVAFSPDGRLVASGNGATAPFEVKLWEVDVASRRVPNRD